MYVVEKKCIIHAKIIDLVTCLLHYLGIKKIKYISKVKFYYRMLIK